MPAIESKTGKECVIEPASHPGDQDAYGVFHGSPADAQLLMTLCLAEGPEVMHDHHSL
jgi:hypothetical protein